MTDPIWRLQIGSRPVMATAVQARHNVRDEVARHVAVGDRKRTRREDPLAGAWIEIASTSVNGLRSRFGVARNRPRGMSASRTTDDAWRRSIANGSPLAKVFQRSLVPYDNFPESMRELPEETARQRGPFSVQDRRSHKSPRAALRFTIPSTPAERKRVVQIGRG